MKPDKDTDHEPLVPLTEWKEFNKTALTGLGNRLKNLTAGIRVSTLPEDTAREIKRSGWRDKGFTFLADPDMADKLPRVYEALQILKAASPLGREIVMWAEENDIAFGEEQNPHWLGIYGGGGVKVHGSNSMELNIAVLAHELMHAVQDIVRRAVVDYSNCESRSHMEMALHCEAAAESFSVRACYEAKLAGCPVAFDQSVKSKAAAAYRIFYELFDETFKRARDKGADEAAALSAATGRVYQAYLQTEGIKNIYNAGTLAESVSALLESKRAAPVRPVTTKTVLAFGRMLNGAYLTETPPALLSDDALFGSNTRLRQAFDYVDLVRFALHRAEDDRDAGRRRETLVADKNPFLGVDLGEVKKLYDMRRDADKRLTILQVMNEVADYNKGQLRLDLFLEADSKDALSGHRKLSFDP